MKVVEGEGNPNAKLVLVGEALGEKEEKDGRVFHPEAPAGGHLRRMLKDAGIGEADIYITNVVPVRPPRNQLSLLPNWREHIPSLRRKIESMRPNLVVALGGIACGVLTGHDAQGDITKWRGSVVEGTLVNGVKVMPTLHPSGLMRGNFSMTPVVVHDLKRALEESKFPEIRRTSRQAITRPSFGDVMEFLDIMKQDERALCVDVENHANLELACLGIGNSPNLALSIPFTSMRRIHYWDDAEEYEIWRKLRSLWRTKSILGQNLAWDLTILNPMLGAPGRISIDTMVASSVLFPEWPRGLDFLCSWYTDLPYYKDEGKVEEKERSEKSRWEYNCKDVMATVEVAQKQEADLKASGLWAFYTMHSNPLVRLYWEMSMRGIRINKEKLNETRNKLSSEAQHIKESLEKELCMDSFNPNSPPQVAHLLYKKLRLPKRTKRGKGERRLTTDQKALEDLRAYYPNPVLDKILDYRHKTKLVGDKLQGIEWRPGYYHSAFNPAGTETGRPSASKFLGKFGTNLQNVDPEIRNIFTPEEGKVFFVVDQEQAEAAVMFWLARDEAWKERYKKGGDVHEFVAKLCGTERQIAKRVVHGTSYGMGPVTFAKYLGVSIKQGRALSEAYHRAVPNVRGIYHASIQDTLRKTRRLVTPWLRTRQFLGRFGEELFKEGYAYVPQSTVADLTHHAALYLHAHGAVIRLNTHDGLVLEIQNSPVEISRWEGLVGKAFDVGLLLGGDVLRMRVGKEVVREWK